MPRPKRTKVAPTVSRVKPTVTQRAQEDPIEDVDDSGQSAIANSKRSKRARRSGIDVDDAAETVTRVGRAMDAVNAERERALEGLKQHRDEAISRLDAENNTSTPNADTPLDNTEDDAGSPAVEVGRRGRGRPGVDNSILAISNFRRVRQPSILGRGRRGRSSSVESDLAESTGVVNRPVKETTRQTTATRRRTRQPSILGRAPRARSSSIGLQMTPGHPGSVLGGRRRARQPSILGTRRREDELEVEYDDLDLDDDEEEFAPEDESTPLNPSKGRLSAKTSAQPLHLQQGSAYTRKRKISPIEVPGSSSAAETDLYGVSSAGSPKRQSVRHESLSPEGVQAALESPSPSRSTIRQASVTARPQTPEPYSDTMAPPASSSLVASSSPPAQILRPSHRVNVQPAQRQTRRQPSRKAAAPAPPSDDESLPSSPPSLTHSPNRPSHGAKAGLNRQYYPELDPATLRTAQLQALLPRRRPRVRDVFANDSDDEAAIDGTGLASDDDELSNLNLRRGRRIAPQPSKRVTKLRNAAASGKGKSRTYGTRSNAAVDSDMEPEVQEEEVDPDDSLAPLADDGEQEAELSQELEARVGKELKLAKRKFEVVDQWELEFEEVTASSSSPWEGR